MKRRILLILIIVVIVGKMLVFSSSAQGVSFRTEPPTIKISVPAGKTYIGKIKVYNQESFPINIKIYLEDFKYSPVHDGSKEFFPAGTLALSCVEWLSFSPSELSLPPFATKEINYTIKVPSDAEGARFGVLFFETPLTENTLAQNYSSEAMTSTLKVNIRVGTLFFIEVKDKVRPQALISNLDIKKDTTAKSLYHLKLDFTNIGNTYLSPKSIFHIMDKSGFIYARGEFNEIYTLPGDSAKLAASWNKPLPAGKYILVLTLDIGKAQEEAGLRRGPVIIKEVEIEVNNSGEILKVGELK